MVLYPHLGVPHHARWGPLTAGGLFPSLRDATATAPVCWGCGRLLGGAGLKHWVVAQELLDEVGLAVGFCYVGSNSSGRICGKM